MTKGFYINLERMRSRREFMEHQFQTLGLCEDFARSQGFDAAELTAETMKNYLAGEKLPRTRGYFRWQLSRVEIAIFESHRRIWQQVVDAGQPYAIILEDDAKLSSLLPNIMEKLERATPFVDVIKLDWIRRFRRFGPPVAAFDLEIRPIVEQRLSSAAAYLITQTGAQKLLEWSLPYSDLVDAFIFQPRASYRLYQIFPAVAVQGLILGKQVGTDGPPMPTGSVPDLGIPRVPESKGPRWFTIVREGRLGLERVRRFCGGDRKLAKEGGWIGFVPLAEDLDQNS